MLWPVSGIVRRGAALAGAAVLAAGCSNVASRAPELSGDVPYQRDRRQASLEVPPDLSRVGIREAYPIPGASRGGRKEDAGRVEVLPQVPDMRIERDGRLRRLIVAAEPSGLWDRVRGFWHSQGFDLEIDSPAIGTMETGWAEKRAALPVGGVREMFERFKRFAYRYGVRDRFRTRFERSPDDEGVTEIHVAHRGAHEVVRGDSYAWAPRPSDPELEAEMLRRLLLFLGQDEASAASAIASPEVARPRPRVELMEDPAGGKYIRLGEEFGRAWRLTALALDRAGFTVEDRDRSQGLFFVRYIDPDLPIERERRWLGRLLFRSRDQKERSGEPGGTEFRIVVLHDGTGRSRIEVQDGEGRQRTGASADRILAVLAQQLE